MRKTRVYDEQGNINIDFLVGLVVFMAAFIYLINAVPGIFIPYQTNAIDISSVAYRTSCILAEDPGWWQIGDPEDGLFYTDWEAGSNINYVTRLGLCVDKRNPNVLSYNKILKMNETVNDDYDETSYKLGLIGTLTYNYSLAIALISQDRSQHVIMDMNRSFASDIVETMDRMVMVRFGEGLLIDCDRTPESERTVNAAGESLLRVNKTPSFGNGNISVRITNFTGNPYDTGLTVAYYMGPVHDDDQLMDANYNYDPVPDMSHQYYIYKTTESELYKIVEYPEYEEYNTTDIIDIVIDGTKLNNTAAVYGMNVSGIVVISHPGVWYFPDDPQNYAYQNPDYRYFDYPGIMKLRVWET